MMKGNEGAREDWKKMCLMVVVEDTWGTPWGDVEVGRHLLSRITTGVALSSSFTQRRGLMHISWLTVISIVSCLPLPTLLPVQRLGSLHTASPSRPHEPVILIQIVLSFICYWMDSHTDIPSLTPALTSARIPSCGIPKREKGKTGFLPGYQMENSMQLPRHS